VANPLRNNEPDHDSSAKSKSGEKKEKTKACVRFIHGYDLRGEGVICQLRN